MPNFASRNQSGAGLRFASDSHVGSKGPAAGARPPQTMMMAVTTRQTTKVFLMVPSPYTARLSGSRARFTRPEERIMTTAYALWNHIRPPTARWCTYGGRANAKSSDGASLGVMASEGGAPPTQRGGRA